MAWYYAVDNQRQGPVTDRDFQSLVQKGTVTSETLVWRHGMAKWQRHGDLVAEKPAQIPSQKSEVPHVKLSPRFTGEGMALFVIHLVNMALKIITLGIYSFWARIKVRKYIYENTFFLKDRFLFHGTGGELIKGWMKVFLALLLLSLVSLGFGWVAGPFGEIVGSLFTWVAILALLPVAVVGSRRYQMSRTEWRGLRFSFRGKTKDYFSHVLPGFFLAIITLGFYYPIYHNKKQSFLSRHTYYGNTRFHFSGNGQDLLKPFLKAVALSLVTLGIYWTWFVAQRQRYYWSHTSISGINFNWNVNGTQLFLFHLVNGLLLLITLGFAFPWIEVRRMRFLTENLTLEGHFDLTQIVQQAGEGYSYGEELAEALDTGFFDMELGL